MTTHDDYMTQRQVRDLARRLARLERKQRSTAAAHADLRHSAVDGGAGVKVKDHEGKTVYQLGTDPVTGVTAPQFKGGPVPAQPAPVFVDVGQRVVKIQHSGLDVHEDPAPADFKHAEVHVSQDEVFEPSLSTFATNLDAANGSVTHSLPAGEWYVGVVWVTLSGQRSPMSEPVLADIEPPVDAQDIDDAVSVVDDALAASFELTEDSLGGGVYLQEDEPPAPVMDEAGIWLKPSTRQRFVYDHGLSAWVEVHDKGLFGDIVAQRVTARTAQFIHLMVDRMDVNSLWADQTWQAAGHFGHDTADQSTLVDGAGLRITKHDHDNETSTDIVRLGGEGIGLVFSDDQGQVTGSLGHEGDAAFRDISGDSLTLAGRPLQDPECHDYVHPSGNQSLISWRPRAIMGWGARQVPVINSNYREYGFLEVAANLEAGRNYWLIVSPFTWSPNDTANHLRIRYTTDGTSPDGSSPFAVNQRMSVDGYGYVTPGGQWLFTPTTTGQHRFMLSIQAWGTINQTITSAGNIVQLVIEDAGSAVPEGTVIREAQLQHPSGNPDIVGPIITNDSYTTTWEATWYQNYSNGGTVPRTDHTSHPRHNPGGEGGWGATGPMQGRRGLNLPDGIWTSLMGFGTATSGDDQGKTLQQALNGADILSIYLELRGGSSFSETNTTLWNPHFTPHTTPPPYFTSGNNGTRLGDYTRIGPGQRARIPIPTDPYGTMLKTGDFKAVGFYTNIPNEKYGGWLDWYGHRPRLVITYKKEG